MPGRIRSVHTVKSSLASKDSRRVRLRRPGLVLDDQRIEDGPHHGVARHGALRGGGIPAIRGFRLDSEHESAAVAGTGGGFGRCHRVRAAGVADRSEGPVGHREMPAGRPEMPAGRPAWPVGGVSGAAGGCIGSAPPVRSSGGGGVSVSECGYAVVAPSPAGGGGSTVEGPSSPPPPQAAATSRTAISRGEEAVRPRSGANASKQGGRYDTLRFCCAAVDVARPVRRVDEHVPTGSRCASDISEHGPGVRRAQQRVRGPLAG